MDYMRTHPPSHAITRRGTRRHPKRSGHPSSHIPTRAKPSTLDSRTLPLRRDETIRPRPGEWSRPLRERLLNRETLSDQPTPLTVSQRTADQPEQPVERSDHDSRAGPEDGDTRVDDEPFHHETHETSASVTTTRKPMLGAHTARVVERARKRDAITETHFRSDLSS